MTRTVLSVFLLHLAAALGADENVAKQVLQNSELLNSGKTRQALDNSLALAARHPKDIAVLCVLARAQYQAEKIADAQATIDRAKALAPDNAAVYVIQGLVFASTKADPSYRFSDMRWKDAAAAWVRATTLDPKCRDAWFNLSVVRALQDPSDLQPARDAYKKAMDLGVERDPGHEKTIQWKP